jgi:hypothetical protein
MPVNHLEYEPVNGFLHNWLTAGPELILLTDYPLDPNSNLLDPSSLAAEVTQPPIERAAFKVSGNEYRWIYYRCQEDHLVHFSHQSTKNHRINAWAYTKILVPSGFTASFQATARGLLEIWINGVPAFRDGSILPDRAVREFEADLGEENDVLVKLSGISHAAEAINFSLRLISPVTKEPGMVKIRIPTHARFPHLYQKYEKFLDNAYLENVVHHQGAHFNLRWAEGFREEAYFEYHVQDEKGGIYVEGKAEFDWKKPVDVGHTFRLYERPYWVALTATGHQYWEQNLRYTMYLPIHILDEKFSESPQGQPSLRRLQALKAASRYEHDIFSIVASMESEQWTKLNIETVHSAIKKVENRESGCEAILLGLLILSYRFQTHPSFPGELIQPIQDCLVHFDYGQLGKNGASPAPSEARAFLFMVTELLCGQRFPEAVFAADGKVGAIHRTNGEALALAWMRQRAQNGFEEWNSASSWPGIIAGLAQLTTLAENETVVELSAVLLDKLLFLLAVQSFKGSFGTTHASIGPDMLKSSQLNGISGITWLLWGAGVLNHHIMGTVSLACSEYEYPSFFRDIAGDSTREYQHHESFLRGEDVVSLVTYKTPDFVLSSIQDFKPGCAGSSEHTWQATFGSEARVFVNHPACSSEAPAYQPGFWSGNATLPRLAQWKDVLISIHRLPEGDWMGFTHAYFPVPAFDEYKISDGWAFMRKGEGYLALTAERGLEFIQKGLNAYRELRSYGLHNTWVCQLGRATQDGSFEEFIQKALKTRLEWQPDGVVYTSLRGEEISFGWISPLQVNGEDKPLVLAKHIQNPFCIAEAPALKMEIVYGNNLLRLNFA